MTKDCTIRSVQLVIISVTIIDSFFKLTSSFRYFLQSDQEKDSKVVRFLDLNFNNCLIVIT